MKINEVITEKERVDEIAPAIIAAAPWVINAARIVGPQVFKWVARHGLKKVASQFGHKLPGLFKKWGPKSPADTSVPDALKTSKVGYGTGQVDPSLATAARQKLAVAGAGVKPKPKPPARGDMSPEAGAAIAQAQQKRVR